MLSLVGKSVFHRFLLNKSCPYLEFLDKNGFEFLRGGQKLRVFSQLSFCKNVEKKPEVVLPIRQPIPDLLQYTMSHY